MTHTHTHTSVHAHASHLIHTSSRILAYGGVLVITAKCAADLVDVVVD